MRDDDFYLWYMGNPVSESRYFFLFSITEDELPLFYRCALPDLDLSKYLYPKICQIKFSFPHLLAVSTSHEVVDHFPTCRGLPTSRRTDAFANSADTSISLLQIFFNLSKLCFGFFQTTVAPSNNVIPPASSQTNQNNLPTRTPSRTTLSLI